MRRFPSLPSVTEKIVSDWGPPPNEDFYPQRLFRRQQLQNVNPSQPTGVCDLQHYIFPGPGAPRDRAYLSTLSASPT
jgi:hypothetical protein